MPDARKPVRIAVDAMGGDHAPQEIVKGAVIGSHHDDVSVILVGPVRTLAHELAKHNTSGLPIRCVDADEVVAEGECPGHALGQKRNSSIAVATELLKRNSADALVSAGSTGAVAVNAIRSLGLLPGIERPVICAPLVGFAPKTVIVDGGANVDCKPHHMLTFAVVGSVYVKKMLNIAAPRIALLSNGAEEQKGNTLIKEAYSMLRSSGLNFIGNIEGHDILSGRANVIVCDGIVGNVLMKFYESLGQYIVAWVRGRISNLPLVGSVRRLLDQLYAFSRTTQDESDGGGLLWGVNGVVQIMHGSSQAQQLSKAIARARDAVSTDMIGALKQELAAVLALRE